MKWKPTLVKWLDLHFNLLEMLEKHQASQALHFLFDQKSLLSLKT